MDLSLISKYRIQLMGIAMLLVVFSHLPIPISNPVFHFLQWNGHFGVDIFVLLSGMGLYYSFFKDDNLKKYYTKRFIRVLPIYIIINLSYLLTPGYIQHHSFGEIIATITTVGYWFNYGYCDWFVPHILLMYLIFPLFYRSTNRLGIKTSLLILFICWIGLIILQICDNHFYRAAFRWLVFVLGVLLGKELHEKNLSERIVQYTIVLLIVGTLFSIYLFVKYSDFTVGVFEQALYQKGYIYAPYYLMVIGFCYLFCYSLEKINKSRLGMIIIGGGQINWVNEFRTVFDSHMVYPVFISTI